jgi:hypothetical protein
VTFHHEFGVQRRNQRQDRVHVLYAIIQGLECTIVFDVLVDLRGWVALLSLHVFDQGH